MAKDSIKESAEIIKTMSDAIVAVNGTYVKDKDQKDFIIVEAFGVISNEIKNIKEERNY